MIPNIYHGKTSVSPFPSIKKKRLFGVLSMYTLPETNIPPENRPSQKDIHLPTIDFQVQAVSFREGILRIIGPSNGGVWLCFSQGSGISKPPGTWDPMILRVFLNLHQQKNAGPKVHRTILSSHCQCSIEATARGSKTSLLLVESKWATATPWKH